MAGDHDRGAGARRAAGVSIVLDLSLAGAKLAAGILGQSMAMLADALHSMVDIACSLVVAVSVTVGSRPPDRTHPYGHGKVETVGTGILGLVLLAAGLKLGLEGLSRATAGGIAVPGAIAAWVAAGSLVVKELLFHYVRGVGRRLDSAVVRAHAWHHRTDALTSLGALVGVTAARLGFTILDPLVAVVIAFLIVRAGASFAWSSLGDLVDAAPPANQLMNVCRAARSVPGVDQVADVRVRRYGPAVCVDLLACVRGDMSVEEGHHLVHRVEDAVSRGMSGVREVSVHLHPCRGHDESCETLCAELLDRASPPPCGGKGDPGVE